MISFGQRRSALSRLLVIFMFLAATVHSFAQAGGTASVQGAVTDPTGAAVPGATVTLTNNETHQIRTVNTDNVGRYALPNVPPGPYTLVITAPNFSRYNQTGIVLEVGQAATFDAAMTLGSTTEEITVQSNNVTLETETVNFKQVVDQKRIVELPLNGRQATELVLVTGGAVTAPTNDMVGSKNYASSTVISVAGGQGNYNNYVLDGGYHTDNFTNVNAPYPFPDALREFSVESNSLPARNGIHPGALVNGVTKSGTNQWHGSLFEFIRNNVINSTNFFATSVDNLKRNQFGGTFGGPIIKDKLFFFGGYQGTRERKTNNATNYCLPTAAELAGDFSKMGGNCAKNVADGKTLLNPSNGTVVSTDPTNPNYRRVNPSTYSTAALKLLSYLPLSQADQYGFIRIALPGNNQEDQYVGKVDYTVSPRHSIFFRTYLTNYKAPAYFSPTNLLLTTTAGNDERVMSYTLGDTFNINERMVNTFHGTYIRRRNNRGPTAGGINAQTIGVNVYTYVPADLRLSITNGFSVGCGTCSPGFFNVNTEDFADDIDYQRGKHSFAFGAEFIRTGDNTNAGYLQNGQYTFNGQLSGAQNGNTGEGMLDYLTGRMQSFGQSRSQQTTFRQNIFSFYGQDTWHLTSKLTLTYGVRWEPMLYQKDKYNRGSTFDRNAFNAGTKSIVYPNAPAGSLYPGDPGIPAKLTNDRLNNISPRLGIAFSPDDKTVFRAGGAIMYDSPNLYTNQRQTTNAPFTNEIGVTGNLSFDNPYSTYPGGSPFPGVFPPDKTAVFPTQGAYVIMTRNARTPTIYQWTASLQRDLGMGWGFSINYLGNRNTHQYIGNYFNQAIYIPGTYTGAGSCGGMNASTLTVGGACSTTASANANARTPLSLQNFAQGQYYTPTMVLIDDHGFSDYHGMIASVQHKGSGSFSFLGNYTWSKCLSLQDNPGDVAGATVQNSLNPRGDYSYCGFDIRHIVNVTIVAETKFHFNSRFANALANGWQASPLVRILSGAPFNVTSGSDRSLTAAANDRPVLVPGVDPYSHTKVTQLAPTGSIAGNRFYFRGAAFTLNPTGSFGTLPRNYLRGPNYFNVNLSLVRNFKVRENLRMQVRMESFNLFNHPFFNGFTTANPTAAQFGWATGAADPRIFQGAVKFTF